MDSPILYIIVYDISDDKRRTKVHKVLCGYGIWTQYSLFECWLTKAQLLELRAKLMKHLIANQDSLRYYPLCANCQGKVITVGGPRPDDPITVIL